MAQKLWALEQLDKGMSQKAVAAELNCSQSVVSTWRKRSKETFAAALAGGGGGKRKRNRAELFPLVNEQVARYIASRQSLSSGVPRGTSWAQV